MTVWGPNTHLNKHCERGGPTGAIQSRSREEPFSRPKHRQESCSLYSLEDCIKVRPFNAHYQHKTKNMSLHGEEKRQKFAFISNSSFLRLSCTVLSCRVLSYFMCRQKQSRFFWDNVVKMFNQIFPDAEHFFYGLNLFIFCYPKSPCNS